MIRHHFSRNSLFEKDPKTICMHVTYAFICLMSLYMSGNLTYTTVHTVVCICLFRWVCMFLCVCERVSGGGGVGIIWACQCTTVSCFVAVMDSHKMKGRMEAENLVACCLKKLTWVAIAAGHEGQVFAWDAGELIHCGSGEGEAGWWDSGWVKSLDSTWLWLGHCLLLISSIKSEKKFLSWQATVSWKKK